jgi:hypothetical protein
MEVKANILRAGAFNRLEHIEMSYKRGDTVITGGNIRDGYVLIRSVDPDHCAHSLLEPDDELPNGHSWLLISQSFRALEQIAKSFSETKSK